MKMKEWSQEKVQQALQQLYKEAARDSNFRQICLNNPTEAVKQITGQQLPEGFKLRFVENEGADMTLVLPDMQPTGNLSDDELESVAGGMAATVGECGDK